MTPLECTLSSPGATEILLPDWTECKYRVMHKLTLSSLQDRYIKWRGGGILLSKWPEMKMKNLFYTTSLELGLNCANHTVKNFVFRIRKVWVRILLCIYYFCLNFLLITRKYCRLVSTYDLHNSQIYLWLSVPFWCVWQYLIAMSF